jgi:hypothetical protein
MVSNVSLIIEPRGFPRGLKTSKEESFVKKTFGIIIAVILVMATICTSAFAEEQRYAEPQLAWVSTAQASVRWNPRSDEAPLHTLKNGDYVVVLGKTQNAEGKEYYIIDLKYLGYLGEVGYVLKKTVHLGIKEYVKMTSETWAYAQESEDSDGVAQISEGQQRLVLGETLVGGESWLSIQVDGEGNRGVGYVKKTSVSEKFVSQADESLLTEVRAGSAATVIPAQTQQTAANSTASAEVVASTSNFVTVSEATPVYASASAGAATIGTINPGDEVYVYQVGSAYTMVVFNNSFGYVENAKIVK